MFTQLKNKAIDAMNQAKAVLPSASGVKLTACIAAGAAVLLVAQSVATAAMSDLGHEIMDLV